MLWTVLFAVRWPMVLGFAILAMHLGIDVRTTEEAESVLPMVLGSDLFPAGVRGLLIAAMLAAAMSTFDSTINAGASYLVRDVFAVLRPLSTDRQQVWAGYVASALLVAVGLVVALALGAGVLGIWVGIVMLLFPAFLVPFALRWFWARFNGPGFTLGIVGGFAAALVFAFVRPEGWNEATQFLAIAGLSLAASVAGTLANAPVPEKSLRRFHDRVRPLGWWPREWRLAHAAEHRGDLAILAVAVMWQVLTFLIPMGAMLRMWGSVAPAALVWVALAVVLLRRRER
jgi:Na+/proline symporter